VGLDDFVATSKPRPAARPRCVTYGPAAQIERDQCSGKGGYHHYPAALFHAEGEAEFDARNEEGSAFDTAKPWQGAPPDAVYNAGIPPALKRSIASRRISPGSTALSARDATGVTKDVARVGLIFQWLGPYGVSPCGVTHRDATGAQRSWRDFAFPRPQSRHF
jgi:hypothetical protein